MKFKLKSDFDPKGSQPAAIKKLVTGLKNKKKYQTLLGVTGSGKTFTVANVIQQIQKPTIVIAHNKTLAAQLYNEFKDFFPENRVEYFVSYYDYYQPESYIPSKDQYIEKDAQINPKIEQMRLAATASLLSRNDVIVIASVSCIYNVGNPEYYKGMGFDLDVKKTVSTNLRNHLISKLVESQYERNNMELMPGRFRVKGDTIDFIPGYFDNIIRVELAGDKIDRIVELDKVTGNVVDKFDYFFVYPAKHFVMPEEKTKAALQKIRDELDETLPNLDMIEAHRLKQRTMYDLEMIEETGFCKGIENYSMHLEGRDPKTRPFCLLDYFSEDCLIVIDESHQMLPQIRGMFNGDRARKKNLIDYGFRLPSALENRPLQFNEFENIMSDNSVLFVSATPANYELEHSQQVVEQIIRPTGLVDPLVFVQPSEGQIDNLKQEIATAIKRGDRALVTTITKKLAEELAEFLAKEGIKTRYLHSEIDTIERTEIIRELRLGKFDVLVGINLLREGLDIPEVGFIGILDADKEGFLRDARSLIQIIGRAARNINSKVVLYADRMTDSIIKALGETKRRRELQLKHNKDNNITPKTIIKAIKEKVVEIKDTKHIPKSDIPNLIVELEADMTEAADKLDFETAIHLRDQIKNLNKKLTEKPKEKVKSKKK
ncbi:excinuclease ABC subunit UvrB [Candidatus Woesearchaeota archaeon]|jgi:excinuclease ABC subunit B|nr:excinuclease ABC subunit UvrB [Candidatus Woesearchaeota archaeon]MBT6519870.1 excinuclease ABC subunit UvrB [Candidatus Woesearchaeota archaeon]MBT7367162.1 excinuclease ABC subunit UvrB [Candidatus Woesearchaeota archaeon]